jgi:autotransporter-associated beta strand protein
MNQMVFSGAGGRLVLTNGARLFTANGLNVSFLDVGSTIALYSNTVWSMRGTNTNPGNSISGISNRFLITDGAIVTNTFGVGNVLVVNGNHNTIEIVNGGKVYWQNGGILFGQFATRNNRILVGGSGAPAYMQSLSGMQIPQNGGSVTDYAIIVSNGVWDVGLVLLGRSASTGNYISVLAGGVVNFSGNSLSIADTGAGISNYLEVTGGLVTNVSQISVNSNNSMYVNGGTIAAGANGTLLTGAGNAYVRAGGATIDTVAFSVNSVLGLQEDAASMGGGLTKRGSGSLTLLVANTYSGNTRIHAGTLALASSGSIPDTPLISVEAGATFDAGTGFVLNGGQTLAGSGTVLAEVEVDGAISPGIAGIGTLTVSNTVIWNAGVAWPYDLGAASSSDRLSINGDFTMGAGGEGEFVFDLQNSAVAGVYTLVTWTASTTFDDGTEFSAINLSGGLTPSFTVNANELLLTLTGESDGGFSAGSTNTSITVVGGNVQFAFNIASGALYRVQASTNLLSEMDNGFTNITGQLTNLGTAPIIYTNISSDQLRLFRVRSP